MIYPSASPAMMSTMSARALVIVHVRLLEEDKN
jgi:hypothetical protein